MPDDLGSASSPEQSQLRRELNVWHATAIVVGTIIGSGIFLVPAEMMQAAGSASLVYLAWIVGAGLSLFGALTYAELGSRRPYTGGSYVYVRDAYGPLAGFLCAWSTFLITQPASIATIAVGLIRILGSFERLHCLSTAIFVIRGTGNRVLMVTNGQLLAISTVILITALNYFGVRRSGDFQLLFTSLKVMVIVGIAVIVLFATSGSINNFASHVEHARGGVGGFMAALVATLWAYEGWQGVTQVAGEIRQPSKAIPIALLAGTALAALLYMGINASIQYALPASSIAHSSLPVATATQVVLGRSGAVLVSAVMAVSLLTTLNGAIIGGPRIAFAAAHNGYFLRSLGKANPRFHTPSLALLIQAAVSALLVLVGGAFHDLFSLFISIAWLWYMIAASSVFVLRRRDLIFGGAYRMWGYPIVPGLFIASSAVLLFYTFADNVRGSAIAVLGILVGIPVFYLSRSRRKNTGNAAPRQTSDTFAKQMG